MNILIESYNTVKQNKAGGVQTRIKKFLKYSNNDLNLKLFDKWNDNIEEYDILHIFKLDVENYKFIKLAKNKNIPVVISSVIPDENKFKIFLNRLICRVLPIHTGYWFMGKMLKDADKIVAQTKKEKEFIIKNYKVDSEKIAIIPNGVNINFEMNVSQEIFNKLGFKKKYILCVGRFDRNKNQLSVIKAMKEYNLPIVFIGGEAPEDPDYYKICKETATDNMYFLGWIKNESSLLSSAYQNAQVVVLPSYKEIFGNSLIEGGGAGANLVSTKELPIKDWGIQDICKTFNPKDLRDIKEKLLEAYDKEKNANTSKIITDKFSWDTVMNKYKDVYLEVLDKKETKYEN